MFKAFYDCKDVRQRCFMTIFVLSIQLNCIAQNNSLLHFSGGRMTVRVLFQSINNQISPVINFNAANNVLNLDQEVSVPVSASLEEIMSSVADQLGLEWHRIKSDIFFTPKSVSAKEIAAPGGSASFYRIRVRGENEELLADANISTSTPGNITTTNANGIAVIPRKESVLVINVTYVGMLPATVKLTSAGDYDVLLRLKLKPLPKKITTGYTYSMDPAYVPANRPTLSGPQLNMVSTGNPLAALEGQETGVLYTQTNGSTSSSSNLSIRGQNSIFNSREPLYIVDNVIFAAQNLSMSNLISGISAGSQSPFSYFNMADIEAIEILKDAEATAIYGSRGANGVIIITTKRGKATKTGQRRFDFQFNSGISQATGNLSLMNSSQYVALRTEAFYNDNITMNTTNAPDVKVWGTNRSTNWRKYLMGDGRTYNFQSSVTGGTQLFNYYIGAGGSQESSIYLTHPLHQRLNTTFNFNFLSKNKRLDVQTSGFLGWDRNHQFLYKDPAWMQFLAPNAPVVFKDAANHLINQSDGVSFINPLGFLYQPAISVSHNYLANLFFTYKILPFLLFRGNLGWSEVVSNETGETPISVQDPLLSPTGTNYTAHTNYGNKLFEPQLEFKKSTRRWTQSLLAGVSYQRQSNNMRSLMATGYSSDSLLGDTTQAPFKLTDNQATTYSYKALFGRYAVILDSTYILNLSYRREGSNRLDPHTYYGNFYAGGAAWLFSKLTFVNRALPFISQGRLRASYGVTGNDQVGNYYNNNPVDLGSSVLQIIPSWPYANRLFSGHQTWERITKLEIGMDLGLLKDRIHADLAWYQNRSTNQLIPIQLPVKDSAIVYRNWPTLLQNRGFEIKLAFQNIRSKNFSWTTWFNWSFPTNKLIKFEGLSGTIYANKLIIGKSLNTAQGFVSQGVNTATGLYQFEDRDGDGKITAADKTVIGRRGVTSFGGMDNVFQYKNVQVEFLFDARFATGLNYLAWLFLSNPPGSNLGSYNNTVTALDDRWRSKGDNATFQQASTGLLFHSRAGDAINNYISSNAMLVNSSFVRLRKMQITYQLPFHLCSKMHLSEVSIFAIGQNLFTLTPYKGPSPELQDATSEPILRTTEIGLRVAF